MLRGVDRWKERLTQPGRPAADNGTDDDGTVEDERREEAEEREARVFEQDDDARPLAPHRDEAAMDRHVAPSTRFTENERPHSQTVGERTASSGQQTACMRQSISAAVRRRLSE